VTSFATLTRTGQLRRISLAAQEAARAYDWWGRASAAGSREPLARRPGNAARKLALTLTLSSYSCSPAGRIPVSWWGGEVFMSLTIELNADEQARLAAAARLEGVAPEELARKVLSDHLRPLAAPDSEPTIALFRQWEREGAARSAEEAAREAELWEQFQTNVNETRAALGMREL
jgi:hypothetical protein